MANCELLDALNLTQNTTTSEDHIGFQTLSRKEKNKVFSPTKSPKTLTHQSNMHCDRSSKTFQNPLSVFLSKSMSPLSPNATSPAICSPTSLDIFSSSRSKANACDSAALRKAWRTLLHKVKLHNSIRENTDSVPNGHLLQMYQTEVRRAMHENPELFALREANQAGSLEELEARTRRTLQIIRQVWSITGDTKARPTKTGAILNGTGARPTARGMRVTFPHKCSTIKRSSHQRANQQRKLSARMLKVCKEWARCCML